MDPPVPDTIPLKTTPERSSLGKRSRDRRDDEGNEVIRLLQQIETLVEKESPIIRCVRYPKLLLSALRELESLVEMYNIKKAIVQQIQYLIVVSTNTELTLQSLQSLDASPGGIATGGRSKFDGHVLHTVICGPPGVGKTKVGTILAKIWMALGLIKPGQSGQSGQPGKEGSLVKEGGNTIADKLREAFFISRILDLQSTVVSHQNRLYSIHEAATRSQDSIVQLRRRIMQLKPGRKRLLPTIHQGALHPSSKRSSSKRQRDENDEEAGTYSSTSSTLGDYRSQWNELLSETKKIRRDFETIIKQSNLEDTAVEDDPETESGTGGKETIISLIPLLPGGTGGKPSESKEAPEPDDIPIVIVSREHFVAEFVGHTAIKTENLLKKNIGKVLFIDEAYSLINGERDTFGMEALTVLNRFMSEHSHEIIIIFAGYKDLLQKTIFTSQPGLRRRCGWTFEVNGYTPIGLATIFRQQINLRGWKIDPDIDLIKFFTTHTPQFSNYGGDTEKLAFCCKLAYSSLKFDQTYESVLNGKTTSFDNVITEAILKQALISLEQNDISKDDLERFRYESMYI